MKKYSYKKNLSVFKHDHNHDHNDNVLPRAVGRAVPWPWVQGTPIRVDPPYRPINRATPLEARAVVPWKLSITLPSLQSSFPNPNPPSSSLLPTLPPTLHYSLSLSRGVAVIQPPSTNVLRAAETVPMAAGSIRVTMEVGADGVALITIANPPVNALHPISKRPTDRPTDASFFLGVQFCCDFRFGGVPFFAV